MTPEQALALRTDKATANRAVAMMTAQNQEQMEGVLGRPVSEIDLYAAHLFGASVAVDMAQAYERNETDPALNSVDPATLSDDLKALVSVDGVPVSYGDLYARLGIDLNVQGGAVNRGDAEFLQSMADDVESRMKDNMMGYARETGVAAVPPLRTAEDAQVRASAAGVMSSTWGIPIEDVQPLEPDEVVQFKNAMSGGDVDNKLKVMAILSGMGPTLAQSAYKQLGVEGKVYAHAAGLMGQVAGGAAAHDIVRGRTFMDNNPDFIRSAEVDKASVVATYGARVNTLVGSMGSDAATGGAWQSVLDSAFAHYVQTYSRAGNMGVDGAAFEKSIDAVLGGTAANPAIGEFNGADTVLPRGVSADSLGTWLEYSEIEDWAQMATRGLPPRYANGEAIDPVALRKGGTLEAVGAGKYRVRIDGAYATTGRINDTGRSELYVVDIDAKGVESKLARILSASQEIDIRLRSSQAFIRSEVQHKGRAQAIRDVISGNQPLSDIPQ
ncbi:MAG: hypothetical protein KAR40_15345 [Candidatus Sabulitectum sp.]|nr:hypothetical protein [Candidatus Sabulitectum sp.]